MRDKAVIHEAMVLVCTLTVYERHLGINFRLHLLLLLKLFLTLTLIRDKLFDFPFIMCGNILMYICTKLYRTFLLYMSLRYDRISKFDNLLMRYKHCCCSDVEMIQYSLILKRIFFN